jgi:hypothetical protein
MDLECSRELRPLVGRNNLALWRDALASGFTREQGSVPRSPSSQYVSSARALALRDLVPVPSSSAPP